MESCGRFAHTARTPNWMKIARWRHLVPTGVVCHTATYVATTVVLRDGFFPESLGETAFFYRKYAILRCFMKHLCNILLFYGGCVQNDVVSWKMCAKRRSFMEDVCKTTSFYSECVQNDVVL